MSENNDQLEHRLRALAARAELVPLPSGRAVRAASDRRRRRRFGALVLGAVVIVGAASTAALWPKESSTLVPASKSHTVTSVPTLPTLPSTTVPAATVPTTTVPSTTAPTTTVPTANITEATIAGLDAYVSRQASAASNAAAAAGRSSALVSVHSSPVEDRGVIVAVAAFSYSAAGKPVEVLSEGGGRPSPPSGPISVHRHNRLATRICWLSNPGSLCPWPTSPEMDVRISSSCSRRPAPLPPSWCHKLAVHGGSFPTPGRSRPQMS
jgi:hypothetical protein